jgi:hypothetical protein
MGISLKTEGCLGKVRGVWMGLWSAEYLFGKNSKKTENRASVIEMIAPVKKSRGFGGMPENFKLRM